MERVCIYNTAKKRRIEIIDLIVILIILGFSIFLLVKYNIMQEELTKEVARYGVLGVFGIAFLLEMFPQFWHPFVGVILASSIGINTLYATAFAIVGSVTGSILAFEIGRK